MQTPIPLPPDFFDGTADPVKDYLTQMAATLAAISQEQIWSVINALFIAWAEKSHIYLFGNGGSAATASHMANDLNKFTIVEGKPRLKAISLSDNVPLMTAWANDVRYEDVFAEQLTNFLVPGDVVIALSTSGNSPNILKALQTARQLDAVTIGFTGNQGGKLKNMVDYCIFVPDDYIGRQEDGHMILDHVISYTLRWMISQSTQFTWGLSPAESTEELSDVNDLESLDSQD
jgi:D-sedoheptulose 7-phosphate isomerase